MARQKDDDSLAPRHDPRRLRDENEIDRMARSGGKTEWVERSAPAAGDPPTKEELRGLDPIGLSDPRGDGAIAGASDPRPYDPLDTPPLVAPRDGTRRNPPEEELPPDDGSTL